jgi:hypothetical protein
LRKICGYKNGQKNNWRKWQWNRIVERLESIGRPRKETVVLCLAGMEDLDRREAIRRGFRSDNLIAIDLSSDVVKTLRGKGGIASLVDLNDAISVWRPPPTIDVLVADFCGGFSEKSGMGLINSLIANPLCFSSEAIIAVNMLRGRDGWSNESDWPFHYDKVKHLGESPLLGNRFWYEFHCRPVPVKHRGQIFLAILAKYYLPLFAPEHLQGSLPCQVIMGTFSPAFWEYKSATNFFDSVVFRLPHDRCFSPTGRDFVLQLASLMRAGREFHQGLERLDDAVFKVRHALPGTAVAKAAETIFDQACSQVADNELCRLVATALPPANVDRTLAAAKAVRTMKRKAILNHAPLI